MQNLSDRYALTLTPTSQEGGNLIQPDLGKAAMTAPGSEPVTPLPPPVQGSDPAPDFSGPRIPVSSPKPQPGHGYPSGGDNWVDTPDTAAPGNTPVWKVL